MILAMICVHGVRAVPLSVQPIPKKIDGAQVQFEYDDPMWDGLSKTVVFQAGDVTKDVLNAGELVNVPPEVVAEVGEILKVGVYGEGIPTLWADLGRIRDATDPSGDETTDPSLPVWEQLLLMVGDLKGLNTTTKENLVAAVNEVLKKGGGTADPEEIREIVDKYLAENPPKVDLKGVVKSVNGETPDENGNVDITMPDSGGNVDCILPVDFSSVAVHSVNHRGYSSVAPENTIPAYIMSKEKGFVCVEADVAFTSDGVAVLLHDSTIDRTSNGSGSISALTFAEVSKYDFGSWKSATYTGTRIPTFAEFIAFCKNVGLHPYIELKNAETYTAAQIQSLVAMVNNCGMRGKVSWISFTPTYLGYVRDADPTARLGYLVENINSTAISTAKTLQTGRNEVFMDSSDYDANAIALCQSAGLPLEIWTINSQSTIENMDSYITGVTSDSLIAENILREKAMNYEYGIDEETEKTLTSISATYSGGNVAVGTAVTALTGIVVTAHYSDGTTAPVTGYTLSGTIAEGESTVTVSYGGKTTTFSVTGVAESGGGGEEDIIPDAVVNLAFANEAENVIPNIGTGGTQYDATVVDYNGSHESSGDGLVLNGHAYANVNYALSKTVPFTICVKGAFSELNTIKYQRLMRTDKDAPSIFYSLESEANTTCAKLSGIKDDSLAAVSNIGFVSGSSYNVSRDVVPPTENHTYVFVGDVVSGTIKYYIDGTLMANQPISGLAATTLIGMGDNEQAKNYYADAITITDFRIWNTALSAEQVAIL